MLLFSWLYPLLLFMVMLKHPLPDFQRVQRIKKFDQQKAFENSGLLSHLLSFPEAQERNVDLQKMKYCSVPKNMQPQIYLIKWCQMLTNMKNIRMHQGRWQLGVEWLHVVSACKVLNFLLPFLSKQLALRNLVNKTSSFLPFFYQKKPSCFPFQRQTTCQKEVERWL